jgi:hypothetical protein
VYCTEYGKISKKNYDLLFPSNSLSGFWRYWNLFSLKREKEMKFQLFLVWRLERNKASTECLQ